VKVFLGCILQSLLVRCVQERETQIQISLCTIVSPANTEGKSPGVSATCCDCPRLDQEGSIVTYLASVRRVQA